MKQAQIRVTQEKKKEKKEREKRKRISVFGNHTGIGTER